MLSFGARFERTMMLLAGDIGGTGTRLGVFSVEDGRLTPIVRENYRSGSYSGIEAVLEEFLRRCPTKPVACTFGIAGPVLNDVVKTSNLPWRVDARLVEASTGLNRVALINDLEANAYGVDAIEAADLETLQEGNVDPRGNACIISAGTGLGEAGYFFDGEYLRPMGSEGGHADFGPSDEEETRLLEFLRDELSRVSWEHLLSGQGLVRIYRFLEKTDGLGAESRIREVLEDLDLGPKAISFAASTRNGCRADRALTLFTKIYGSAAANLALTFKATGGVFIGGGIAAKNSGHFLNGSFLNAFREKAPMSDLLSRIPVRLIRNDNCALLGAARHAALRNGVVGGGRIRSPFLEGARSIEGQA